MNNFTLSVKNKIFLIFVFVMLFGVSLIGWYGFISAKDAYIKEAFDVNKGETKALSKEIKGVLGTVTEDILYNAKFYALEKFLVWDELQEKNKIAYWKNIYISGLKDYLYNKKLYYQVRILDKQGEEQLLLKYNDITSSIIEIEESELKNRSYRDYFRETLKLKEGEFYISDMDLNTENGKIEKPYIPVVRYSTPLIDSNGDFKGVLVLNFNVNNILEKIAAEKAMDSSRESQEYYLLNENGDYLFNSDKSKQWGKLLGTDDSFINDYKGILELFQKKDEITFREDGKIFSMSKIYPNKMNNKERFWYLVSVVDEKSALASLNQFMSIFMLLFLVIIASGLFIINSYISRLINPLLKVTHQLKSLAKGEIRKESIEYKANDEIGEMVQSTAILIDAIETTIDQANSFAHGNFSKDIELLGKHDSLGVAIQGMTQRFKEITELATYLAQGNYDVNIVIKDSNDKLGLALLEMVKYLKNITDITESISLGNLDVEYNAKGQNDRLGLAVLQMIEYLRGILKQANAIAQEDFSTSIEAKSKNDELGLALIAMTNILRFSSTRNKDEIYFSDGIGEFGDQLTGITEVTELSKKAITLSSRYVNAASGVLYTFDTQKIELNLVASYAYTARDNLATRVKLGEGVVGQVALEKEPILLQNIKNDTYNVETGTTLSTPKEVYTFPIIQEGELYGVIEMMTFEPFSQIQKEYLTKMASLFAASLHTTTQNEQIKVLLEKSQSAYEELQTQSEELQETNVQMEEQQQQLTLQSHELKVKNETLAKAKAEIDKRADDLEKASKYKSEFLANMSHELRTPLNSIILLSKLLSNNQNSTLNEKDIEKSKVINKAGNELLFLINDILDLSKIESGNMELESKEVSSSEITDELQGLFGAVADEKNIAFNINDNFKSSFYTDKTKFLQVMKNLLSNAFKFTKHGSVTMSINATTTKTKLIFTVKDSGIGIPSDKLETIFEAFKQVDGSISREYGGTGLGLSITKTIVELMGGSVNVETELGVGTSFIVTIPLKKDTNIQSNMKEELSPTDSLEEERHSEVMSTAESEAYINPILVEEDAELEEGFEPEEHILSGKNILIVDDDSRNIFSLTSTLESMDAEVYSAFNGQEALEALEDEERIDLILMDIMMPVMDGLEAMKKIKENPNYKDIPIIAITAKTMQEDKEKCFEYGANDYLAKPLNHDAFVAMLKAWIR